MTLKDEALAQIQQQKAEAARAEELRRNPPPMVYEYSVDPATAADIRVLVEEFQRCGIKPWPMITIDVSSARGKYGWSRRTEYQVIHTATHVNKRGWMLSSNGSTLDLAITEDGGLVPAAAPAVYKDDEQHYAEAFSTKMGMHNGYERKATIHRGFGRVATEYIHIGVGNSIARPADTVIEVSRSYSSNSDDYTSYYRTLHEVLVDTLATLIS
jgi:hypothetical protein